MVDFGTWKLFTEHGRRCLIESYAGLCREEEDLLTEPQNIKLFSRFLSEAHAIARHRERYSARTIVEVLRHNSLAHDSDEEFKISNNITPIMAYASMQMFPALNGLFIIKGERRKP